MKNFLLIGLLFLIKVSVAQDFSKLTYLELDSISYIPKMKGEYTKAIPYIEASRNKAKLEFGTQDTIYAYYTNELGMFNEMIGHYSLAEELLLEAQKIFVKTLGKKHLNSARNSNSLGELYLSMGRLDEAEVFFGEAKEIYAAILGREHETYATILNNLAALHKDMGNFSQAELLHIETKNIRAKTLGKEHPHYANSLNNLALMYKTMGRFAEAEPLYLEAAEIKEKVLGENHPQYAQGLNNLALLYFEMGKYGQVEPLLLKTKAIQAKVLGTEHPVYALSISNLAGMYQDMKQYKKSEKLYLEAMAIRAKVYGIGHPNYTSTLNSLALLYYDMNNPDLTWEYMQQALVSASGISNISLDISEAWKDSLLQVHYPSYPYMDKMIRALRNLYIFLENSTLSSSKEQQIIVADLANLLLKKSKDGMASEQDKLRLLSQSYAWMLNSLKVLDLDKHTNKIFEIMELNKASLLLEATKAEENYHLGGLPNSLVEEEKALLKKQAQFEAEFLENRTEQEKENLLTELNKASQEIILFKKKVENQYPKYAALKYKSTDIQIQDVQKLLSSNSALLEYVIGDSVVYICYVDKKQTKVIRQSIAQTELNQRIKELQEVLSNYNLLNQKSAKAYRLYVEQAYWFYQNLLAPVLTNNRIEQLIIISDAALGHLPFEVFLVDQAPQTVSDYSTLHYLVKDYKISYNYSATLWKTSKKVVKRNNNRRIFAMAGNYDSILDSTYQHLRLPNYQRLRAMLNPLPSARKEVETLEQEFNGFFGFYNNASEKIFKEKASDYAVIHLAMHGLLDYKKPILSSLVFTEDGDSIENNFLQAYEISKMDLNADLVVLSACQTGTGKFEKGNGIASLGQAFAYAGVPALIVSLWQVNDYTTSEIMKNLYQNLANGMDKDEALRQAKLKYIQTAKNSFAHPAFWSPFILMGNTDAIYLKQKGGWFWWGIGVGAMVLLGAGFCWLQRKKNLRTIYL